MGNLWRFAFILSNKNKENNLVLSLLRILCYLSMPCQCKRVYMSRHIHLRLTAKPRKNNKEPYVWV